MSQFKNKSRIERSIIHLTLLTGSMLFCFPFLWMLFTSAKAPREMTSDRLRFLPVMPQPVETSPYVDRYEFMNPGIPEGLPESVWRELKPRVETRIDELVSEWTPATTGPEDQPSPAKLSTEAYAEMMRKGLVNLLSARWSDAARDTALQTEKARRIQDPDSGPLPHESILMKDLHPESIQAGIEALLSEIPRLITPQRMREVFDAGYRRFTLGHVRLRSTDFSFRTMDEIGRWNNEGAALELVSRFDRNQPVSEARLAFTPEQQTARFEIPLPPEESEQVDRLYVAYRPDDSWAKIQFEVIRDGERYLTQEDLFLSGVKSREAELRFTPNPDPMQRKTYYLLHPAGEASPGDPAFALRVHLEKSTLPQAWWAKTTENYRLTFREVNFARYIATSFSLSILNILLAIFSCTLIAYGFARLEWPGRNFLFALLLATMMIPPQVTMIPRFLINRQFGWYNTLVPLWLPSLFGAPFFIFLLRQFFKNIPRDLEEAARIDGCGFLRIYWHVMLPLVKPTIATIAIFTFMASWNNFMTPLIYVNDERLFPLALGLFKFSLGGGSDVGQMMAGSFVMTLPVITLFFFAQRYFIEGISMTGTKG